MPVLATLEAAGLCREHFGDVTPRQTARGGQRPARPRPPDDGTPPRRSRAGSTSVLRWCTAPGPRLPSPGWKGQINENAKAPAFFNELPELDHNELMGWTGLPHVTSSTVALFLQDESCGSASPGRRN